MLPTHLCRIMAFSQVMSSLVQLMSTCYCSFNYVITITRSQNKWSHLLGYQHLRLKLSHREEKFLLPAGLKFPPPNSTIKLDINMIWLSSSSKGRISFGNVWQLCSGQRLVFSLQLQRAKLQILLFKKLELEEIWHFCLVNDLSDLQNCCQQIFCWWTILLYRLFVSKLVSSNVIFFK